MLGARPSINFVDQLFYFLYVGLAHCRVHDLFVDHAEGVFLLHLIDNWILFSLAILRFVFEFVVEVVDNVYVCIAGPTPRTKLLLGTLLLLVCQTDFLCDDLVLHDSGLDSCTGCVCTHARARLFLHGGCFIFDCGAEHLLCLKLKTAPRVFQVFALVTRQVFHLW